MEIEVVKPDLDDLTDEGIPRDLAEARDNWNLGVGSQKGIFRFIPRRKEITNNEIRQLFVPAILDGTSLHLVAKVEGKVVGAITAIYDVGRTQYEYRNKRLSGAIGESVDPRIEDYGPVLVELYKGLVNELRKQNKTAHVIVPVEDSISLGVLRSLGFEEEKVNHEIYTTISLSGVGIRFELS